MDKRKLIPWTVRIVLAMLAAVFLLAIARRQPETISLQTLANEITDGQIMTIAIADEVLHVERADGSRAVVNRERDESFAEALTDLGFTPEMMNSIEIKVMAPGTSR
jgi:predicted outer membrane protein